jgi:hypothetical protein
VTGELLSVKNNIYAQGYSGIPRLKFMKFENIEAF